MSGISVLQGFVSGTAPIHEPSLDPRFVGLDHSDMLDEWNRQRLGPEICITEKPLAEFNSPRRHNDSVAHEGELALPDSDFRALLDAPVPNKSCSCRMRAAGELCPHCGHPALYEYEVCLCRAVPIDLFDRIKCRTKRKAIALTDDGTALSDEFCAVIIHQDELAEIMYPAVGSS